MIRISSLCSMYTPFNREYAKPGGFLFLDVEIKYTPFN